MICFMHEGNPYGHLKVGNKVILPPNLASMVGATLLEVEGWLNELHQAGVYEIAETGEIYSKRMVRDEILRNKRAEGGKLGGNPALKVNHEDNLKVANEDKQKPTPSSSSSSSSSSTKKNTVAPPYGVTDSVWQDWLKLRKAKKAAVTQTAIDGIAREASKAGVSLQVALETCCARGWTGFKADWLAEKMTPTQKAQNNMHELTRGLTAPKPFWNKPVEVENDRLLR
jgi:hypothetical protein